MRACLVSMQRTRTLCSSCSSTLAFAEIAEKKDDHKKCYEQSGKCLKLSVYVDFTNRTKVAILRCNTNDMYYIPSPHERNKCLDMFADDIYYIPSETVAAVRSSTSLEALRKKSSEVLHMVDQVKEGERELLTKLVKEVLGDKKKECATMLAMRTRLGPYPGDVEAFFMTLLY